MSLQLTLEELSCWLRANDRRWVIYGLVGLDELRRMKVVRDLVAVNEMVEIGCS